MPAAKSITINFDTNISKVSYKNEMFVWTNGETKDGFDWSDVFTVTLNSGYIIDTVTATHTSVTSQTDTTFTINSNIAVGTVITITSKQAVVKKSVDLTTLSGWSSLADGTHTITIKAKADGYRDSEASAVVEVTKGSSTVTLEAGTYLINEQPTLNMAVDMNLTGKMNTLTADNTYGGQTTFDNFYAAISSSAELGGINFGNNDEYVQYAEGDWSFVSSDGDTYTASDTTKLRTIILETDQQVSQEFYDWAITHGNLVRQTSTGETWVLNESISPTTDGSTPTYNITFVSNATAFTSITIGKKERLTYDSTIAYDWNDLTWTNSAYRTITFETAPTSDLLTWLQANGTKQGGATPKGYTVSYTNKGEASASASFNMNDGTWVSITNASGSFENIETIQFSLNKDETYACTIKSNILGINLSANSVSLSDTYTLTKDITDIVISWEPAKTK